MKHLELNSPILRTETFGRGPAKGYIEALETRLQETESVLLGALSVIPDADLALTLMGNSEAQNGTEEGENRVAKPSRSGELLKATAERRRSILEFWKEYPLHSRDDILRWREASLSSRGNQLGLRAGLPERTQSYSVERNEDELSGTVENDNSNGDTHETIQEVFQPARPIYHGTRANEEFDQGQEHHPQFHEVQVADTHIQNTELEPQRSTSVTGFGLSKEFRDKFLW